MIKFIGIRSTLILIATALVGCSDNSMRRYYQHPIDAQVQQVAFMQCLDRIKSAQTIADADDYSSAVRECSNMAEDVARYCIPKMNPPCLVQYQRTRDDVRKILGTESAK